MKLCTLDARVKIVCPIYGISSAGEIWFKPEATEAQKIEAQAIMDARDFVSPAPEEIVAEVQAVAYAVAKSEAQADNIVQYLRDHTPAECEQYVQGNVTDLASAKAFLKKVAIVLCVLSKESLR